MAPFDPPRDAELVNYLLGELPATEASPLDERSIVDPEFFERLDAIENDLIDGYVRGELPTDLQDRFRRGYVTSEARAEKVRLASALAQRAKRPANVIPMKPRAARMAPWLLPVAATIAVVGLGLVFLPNDENRGPDVAPSQQVAEQQPSTPPAETAPAPPPADPGTATQTPPPTKPETLFAFTLAAPRRGVEDLPAITVPAGVTDVTLRLELEMDDFPRYRAVLKDPANDRVLFRSSALTSEGQAASRVVAVMIPARQFAARRYVVELEGIPGKGVPEPIATYVFRIVR